MKRDRIDPAPQQPTVPRDRRLLRIAALLATLVLVTLVILVAVSNQKRDAALSRQRHSYEVLVAIGDFDAAMARAEAALGRFAISGAPAPGRVYRDQWSLAGTHLATLSDLTAIDTVQRPLVARLSALYRSRGTELQAPAQSAATRQGWSALALFDQAGKAGSIARLADGVERVSINERRTLAGLSAAADRSVARSNLLAALLSLLGILLVIGGLLLASLAVRAVRARREAGRRADVAADRAGALEQAVAERTQELRGANERLQAEAATRAAAEAQLHQAQKMEAVGQLTGGIAHDFNNMLAVVVGGLELAKRRTDGDPRQIQRHLDQALDGATRAAALTRRLLAFARAEPLRPEAVDPGLLVAGMSDLLDRTLGEQIRVVTVTGAGGWHVWCDPHQLENAILNLAVNARDALGGTGTVEIRATNAVLSDDRTDELPPGDYLRIDVRDDGCGMPPAVLARALEPFFTTKPVGKGTGLGLSQIFGFVRQSDGALDIRSAPGEGTCVSILLPRHAPTTHVPRPAPVDPVILDGAGEPILVVEDDPRVRTATVEALDELGYAPIACASGDEALALLAARPGIRLVISDVVMPGMTGPELIDRIHAGYPEIATLFVTGYVGDADNGDRLKDHEVLRKPFTIAGLSRMVSAALARYPS